MAKKSPKDAAPAQPAQPAPTREQRVMQNILVLLNRGVWAGEFANPLAEAQQFIVKQLGDAQPTVPADAPK